MTFQSILNTNAHAVSGTRIEVRSRLTQDRTLARNFKEMCNRRPENNGPSAFNTLMTTERAFLCQYDEVFPRQRTSSRSSETTDVLVHQKGCFKESLSVRSSEYSNRAEDAMGANTYSYCGLSGSLLNMHISVLSHVVCSLFTYMIL
jgi:hypothetical protein